ncbi:Hypothetical protein SMAX5B_016079 [Scophthalmus maximus]|uniref:Uncharacterized protein n=1 Tax=Scophthalmus maximus TaxID=52904 RepID=A0A2U9CS16_SCOMX|nr:Hypothetical protein SMAX5B_016079 [Scophthalmus maximus]
MSFVLFCQVDISFKCFWSLICNQSNRAQLLAEQCRPNYASEVVVARPGSFKHGRQNVYFLSQHDVSQDSFCALTSFLAVGTVTEKGRTWLPTASRKSGDDQTAWFCLERQRIETQLQLRSDSAFVQTEGLSYKPVSVDEQSSPDWSGSKSPPGPLLQDERPTQLHRATGDRRADSSREQGDAGVQEPSITLCSQVAFGGNPPASEDERS